MVRGAAERISDSSVGKRIAKGTFWSLVGTALFRALSAVATVVVARILGKEAFGEYAMVRSTIDLFAVFAGFRMGTMAAKYVAEFRSSGPETAAAILKLSLSVALASCVLMAAICVALADRLATQSLGRPALSVAIRIGAVLFTIAMYEAVIEAALSGFEAFKSLAKLSLIKGLLTVALFAPAAYYWGVEGVLLAAVVVALVILLFCLNALRRERQRFSFPSRVPWPDLKKHLHLLWSFALPDILDGGLIIAVIWVARTALVHEQNGYEQLGIFCAADQWRALVLFLPSILGRVMFPILAEAASSPGRFVSAFRKQSRLVWTISLPATVFLLSFSSPMAKVFGKSYAGTAAVIPILLASVFFYSVNSVERLALKAAGRQWVNLSFSMLWGAVYLLTVFYMKPGLNAAGLALANLAAYSLLTVLQLAYSHMVFATGAFRKEAHLYLFSLVLLVLTCLTEIMVADSLKRPLQLLLVALSCFPILALVRKSSPYARGSAGSDSF